MKVLAAQTHFKFRPYKENITAAVDWWRVINPFTWLQENVDWDINIAQEFGNQEIIESDVMYASYILNPDKIKLTRAILRKAGKNIPIIMDFDDDLFNIDPLSRAYDKLHGKEGEIEEILNHVNYLTVSTPELKEAYSDYCEHIFVIPNKIDVDKFKRPIKREFDDTLKIGYFGSQTHARDLDYIYPVLRDILMKYPNVKVEVVCGVKGVKLENLGRVKMRRGTKGWSPWPERFHSLDFDIGICPLKDMVFNKSKSNIKWQEFTMMGIPVVASNFGQYKKIDQGILLADNMKEWQKHLSSLIESKEKRIELVEEAREKVLEDYNMKKNGWKPYKILIENVI